MPVYEFTCLKCKREFEVVASISEFDPAKILCPDCGSEKVERRWSRVFAVTAKKS